MRNGQVHQPIALCVTDKISVRAKQVDGPFYLIHDTLSRWLRLGPKFEVLKSIISPLTIHVMDGFSRKQFAPDGLFHHEPMLKDVAFLPRTGRNGDCNVPVTLQVSSVVSRLELLHSDDAMVGVGTLPRTEPLFVMIGFDLPAFKPIRAFRELFAAVRTEGLAFVHGFFWAVVPRALTRAIHGVFAPILSVRTQVSRLKREILTALLAGEVDALRDQHSLLRCVIAGFRAVLTSLRRLAFKVFPTVPANYRFHYRYPRVDVKLYQHEDTYIVNGYAAFGA